MESIMKLAAELGQEIKKAPCITKMNEAKEKYDKDEQLQQMMFEYNAQQIALAEEYKKDPVDQKVVEAIEARLNDIVASVMASPAFVELNEVQKEVNELMEAVNGEIEFQITGKRPCSHDCHSCGSDCGHHH
ncbi:MAG: YlbF family regulator [Clostridia bacterium]|nr:YlbF family regulator [Clostridia bacterium]